MVNRAARAHDIGIVIFRMNARFHDYKRARNLRLPSYARKG
jgi:hypothetical protein